MPPVRSTFLRVSVRQLVETKDVAWKTVSRDWQHVRRQTLESLVPVTGVTTTEGDRAVMGATWRAVARRPPDIKDGDRLVVLRQIDAKTYADDYVLEVSKVLPRGVRQLIFLREPRDVQPERP